MNTTIKKVTEQIVDNQKHQPWQCMVTITVGTHELFLCGRGATAEAAEAQAEEVFKSAVAALMAENERRMVRCR